MPYNPFRYPKHFQLDDYIQAGWDKVDAELYLDAIQQSFELPNSVMDLRVPYALESSEDKRGFFRAYVHHFNEFYRRTQNATSDEEEMDVMEAVIADLDQEIQDWITSHDIRVPGSPTYWTGEIEEVYRRSFSIPLRAEPEEENEVPVAVAISVLSVGAVLIILSGVYVMRSKRHSVFKLIKGLFNPISSSFFELTMLVFDISGDVLAFVLVVRKDENIGNSFKITYGGFVAFALGISLIAIVVSIVRIRHELGLIKKKPDSSDFDAKVKTLRTASYTKSMSCSAKELSEANEGGDEVMSEGGSTSGYKELLEVMNTTVGGEASQELLDTQDESPVEEKKKIDTIQGESPVEVESPVEMDEKFMDEEKPKLQRKRSSFSDFIIGLDKDDDKNEEERRLKFAEAFTNLMLLVFEDFPVSREKVVSLFYRNGPKLTLVLFLLQMAIMNMIYIMHFSGGNVKFSVIYMLSFAGGLVLLGFKFSKLREVEAIEGVVDKSLLLIGVR